MSESPSIAQLLDRFLSDQEDILRAQQYRSCKNVVTMLSTYLNRYAFDTLSGPDKQTWQQAYDLGDERAFIHLFGVRKLVAGIRSFHEDYLPYRLRADPLVRAHAVTVTRDLADWLGQQD